MTPTPKLPFTPKFPYPAIGTVAHAEVVAALTRAIRDRINRHREKMDDSPVHASWELAAIRTLEALAADLGLTISEKESTPAGR